MNSAIGAKNKTKCCDHFPSSNPQKRHSLPIEVLFIDLLESLSIFLLLPGRLPAKKTEKIG